MISINRKKKEEGSDLREREPAGEKGERRRRENEKIKEGEDSKRK
jgi:hypothetical protein